MWTRPWVTCAAATPFTSRWTARCRRATGCGRVGGGGSTGAGVPPPPAPQPLSDKTGTFTVVVKDVKEERLPELNDEFAREVGEGFSSVQALRRHLEDRIRERLDAEAQERYRDEALEALTQSVEELEFAPVMVEREIDHLLRDQARSAGQEGGRYLEAAAGGGRAVGGVRGGPGR